MSKQENNILYDYRKDNGHNIFTVYDELSFLRVEQVDLLISEIKALLLKGEYRFIFDFTEVPYIDSYGLSTVILTISAAYKNDTTIKICGLNEMTSTLFKSMMDFGIEYFDTIEQILEKINSDL